MRRWLQRMMRRNRPVVPPARLGEQPIAQAEAEAARIRERSDAVRPLLEQRLRRNYWGETARAIARKEPT